MSKHPIEDGILIGLYMDHKLDGTVPNYIVHIYFKSWFR